MVSEETTAGTVVDGVHRLPGNGIQVIIIGAGVGGLGAALECWRKGCEVVVLERAEQLSPLGDYFTITPSALATLKDYPRMHADYHECIYDCSIHVYTPSGVPIYSTYPEWRRAGAHAASDVQISFLKRRPVYARMQLNQLERLGVSVLFGQKVVSVREKGDEVVVSTASGETFVGDVCIGANGIGSSVEGFDTGPDVAVQDSGYAVARVAFPASTLKPDSPAATLMKNIDVQPEFRTYVADDVHLILFLTQDWVAWCFTHADNGETAESWGNLQDPDAIIPLIERSSNNWDPAVLDFVRQTPTRVVDWKLRWRDGTEQWTSESGRLIRLGDAAHAFFPTAGNGAVQALEDGVSLAECLRIGGKENVHWATKVHNKLRFQRVSILQQTGFLNREELHHVDVAAIEHNPEEVTVGFFKIGRWVWNHDPEAYARDNYAACLANLQEGAPFNNTNLPPGHVYVPWSLESERMRIQAGVKSSLKQNGDWSA
ncbi:FAD binding domain-containing protein [Cladophialophora immunda]|nr:FAD binding domain-containing protein [Cladophialophora immunda]